MKPNLGWTRLAGVKPKMDEKSEANGLGRRKVMKQKDSGQEKL
jgi:hypothetical protein